MSMGGLSEFGEGADWNDVLRAFKVEDIDRDAESSFRYLRCANARLF